MKVQTTLSCTVLKSAISQTQNRCRYQRFKNKKRGKKVKKSFKKRKKRDQSNKRKKCSLRLWYETFKPLKT